MWSRSDPSARKRHIRATALVDVENRHWHTHSSAQDMAPACIRPTSQGSSECTPPNLTLTFQPAGPIGRGPINRSQRERAATVLSKAIIVVLRIDDDHRSPAGLPHAALGSDPSKTHDARRMLGAQRGVALTINVTMLVVKVPTSWTRN